MLAANAKLADTSCVSAKYASASNCFHPLTSSDSGRALLVGVNGSCCIAVTSVLAEKTLNRAQLALHVLADYYCISTMITILLRWSLWFGHHVSVANQQLGLSDDAGASTTLNKDSTAAASAREKVCQHSPLSTTLHT